MNKFFTDLLEYTFHFNAQVLDLFAGTIIPEKSLQLINHTINAHEIWNTRIQEKPCATGVWEIRPFETLKEINMVNYNTSLYIIDCIDFDKQIQYANSGGDVFTNTVRDMLFHLVNHSTYHRAQIATDCKLNGITPLTTDYIFFKRDI